MNENPSLRALFDEYKLLTGADICSGADHPNPNAGPESRVYRFQDESIRGYRAARIHMERLLERARDGFMWDDRTVVEYREQRAAMDKAWAEGAAERAAKEREFDVRMQELRAGEDPS
jgi:hypothetical protein